MGENNIIISVVIPVYNSIQTLNELTKRLQRLLRELVETRYELIFVNDGSTDASWNLLKEQAESNEKIIAVNLTRNFGQHNALMCGFSIANGKYIVTIDDDLQNPPEEIPKLFEEIQKGYDVVYGAFSAKRHSIFRNMGSNIIQYVYRKVFKVNIRLSSFRIMKRKTVQFLLSYEKSFTFIDGIIAWYTNNIKHVTVEHRHRELGGSGYSLKILIILALNMVTNFSIVPLELASMAGFFFAMVGFMFGTFFLIKKLFFGILVSGFAAIIVAVTILSGVQLLTVGMLGEYIGRIHINLSNRPQFAIREIIKSDGQPHEKKSTHNK